MHMPHTSDMISVYDCDYGNSVFQTSIVMNTEGQVIESTIQIITYQRLNLYTVVTAVVVPVHTTLQIQQMCNGLECMYKWRLI